MSPPRNDDLLPLKLSPCSHLGLTSAQDTSVRYIRSLPWKIPWKCPQHVDEAEAQFEEKTKLTTLLYFWFVRNGPKSRVSGAGFTLMVLVNARVACPGVDGHALVMLPC